MLNNNYIQELLKKEEYAKAIDLLNEELRKDKNNVTALALLAHCKYRLGNFAESAELLSTAIKFAPQDAQLYCDRGISYYMLQNRQASLEDFDRAQQLEPANPYRYSSRAYVKDAFGNTKGAIEDYQKTLELDPEDAIAYNNLGLLLEKLGYKKEAQQHFAKADALEGRPAQTLSPPAEVKEQKAATQPPSAPKPQQQFSMSYYSRVIKDVLTTRRGFRDFVQHWLGKRS